MSLSILRHLRHKLITTGVPSALLLTVAMVELPAACDELPAATGGPALTSPATGVKAEAIPRFGTIRVAMTPVTQEPQQSAGSPPSHDIMRTPPTNDITHPPITVGSQDVGRYPRTDQPRVAQSTGATAPSLFGDASDSLFSDPPPATTTPGSAAKDVTPPKVQGVDGGPGLGASPLTPPFPPITGSSPGENSITSPDAVAADTAQSDTKKEKDEQVDLSVLARSPLFSPDPCYGPQVFDPAAEMNTFTGKHCFPTQRPWIELGRGLYRPGEIPPSPLFLGETNPVTPRFLLFGDYRTALGYVDNGVVSDKAVWAHQLNLDFDFKVTSTERFHAFWSPLDEDGLSSRVEADQNQFEIREAFDDDFDTLFFEGDLGAIVGGMNHQFTPFDLPFVVGKYPMLLQNGVWLFDVLEGFSFSIPARNSSKFDIPNYDITMFVALDDVDSPAFGKDDNAANLFGAHGFFDVADGYLEWGYGFLDDTTSFDRSYHSMSVSFSRRYWHRLSNAVRIMTNIGQNPDIGPETADGALVLFENALITSNPNFFVPYMNMFAGVGRPQSLARAAGAGGVLFGTGITFESDNGLTGFPTLDATAQNAYGGAVGVNLIGANFSSQWVFELSTVQTYGRLADQIAAGDQYGAGIRYQLPINNAWLLRFDAMHGFREKAADVTGGRAEMRWKF